MRKLFIYILLLTISVSGSAQIETVKLSAFEIKSQSIKAELAQKDTTKYVIITFQNAKYSQLSDIGTISFFNNAELDKFENDLTSSIPYIKPQKILEWTSTEFRIKSNEVLGLLTVYDKNNKYFYLSKKNAENLMVWLESITF